MWSWDLRSNCIIWSSNLEHDGGAPECKADGAISILPQDFPKQEDPGLFGVISKTLTSGAPARAEYRLTGPLGRDDRWLEASATVVFADGQPVRLMGISRDVTERLRVYREVRVRARQQETLGRLSERALTETDLQKFFNEVVGTLGEILDVELVKILELLPGDAELLLRAGIGWKPGHIGTAHISTGRDLHAGYALASARAVIAEDLGAETRFRGEQLLHDHGAVSGISAPIAGHDGRAYGVLGAHTAKRRKFTDYEVSFLASVANIVAGAIQRRQLDQRHELMIRELRHRSGNLFSQLLALFSQTAKNSQSVAELVTKYEARVLALANAHRLITEGGWKSTSLTDLLTTLLAPFLDRMSFKGPNVFLEPDPTFGLSMAVHELVTNVEQARQPHRPEWTRGTWVGRLPAPSKGSRWCSTGRRATGQRPGAGHASRLWLASYQHGDRTPAQWTCRAAVRTDGAAYEAHGAADARKMARRGAVEHRWPRALDEMTFYRVVMV